MKEENKDYTLYPRNNYRHCSGERKATIGVGHDIVNNLAVRDTMSFCKKISSKEHEVMINFEKLSADIKRSPSDHMKLVFKNGVIL